MKRMIAIGLAWCIAQSAVAQSALEKAEKRIAELVAPGQSTLVSGSLPIAWQPGRAVVEIEVPIAAPRVVPARLPLPPLREVKPRSVPEARPLLSFREESQGPKPMELPTKPLIRLPSLDVQTPLAIPILSRPVVDRASLAEPAFEASVSAAMKPVAPTRDRPVSFTPYNIPDPFENVRYGQLRQPPPEDAQPPVIPVQRPTK